MPVTIRNTADLARLNGAKCLVYGAAGAGKTRLLATAPRPIVFSGEKGLLSIKQERVPYIEFHDYKTLEEIVTWALNSTEARKYDTFGLDSISEIAEVVLYDEGLRQKDPRKLYPQYQDKMLELFRIFRDFPQKHVVFTAKETKTVVGLGAVKYGPSFPGQKLPEAAPYFFDEVFRLVTHTDTATGVVQRALKTLGDLESEGKDRSGTLAPWEPPNLTEVFTKIMRA